MSTETLRYEHVRDVPVKDCDGKEWKMGDLLEKVTLLVDLECSKQWMEGNDECKELQNIYNKYNDKGLEILAFPRDLDRGNNISASQMKQQLVKRYQITFPVMETVPMNEQPHPLFTLIRKRLERLRESEQLTDKQIGLKWDLSKFMLIDGEPVKQFASTISFSNIEREIKCVLDQCDPTVPQLHRTEERRDIHAPQDVTSSSIEELGTSNKETNINEGNDWVKEGEGSREMSSNIPTQQEPPIRPRRKNRKNRRKSRRAAKLAASGSEQQQPPMSGEMPQEQGYLATQPQLHKKTPGTGFDAVKEARSQAQQDIPSNQVKSEETSFAGRQGKDVRFKEDESPVYKQSTTESQNKEEEVGLKQGTSFEGLDDFPVESQQQREEKLTQDVEDGEPDEFKDWDKENLVASGVVKEQSPFDETSQDVEVD